LEYLHFLTGYFEAYPYLLVLSGFFLLLFLFPIPEELILFTGGLLAAQHGEFIWVPTLIAGISGVFITDYWYFVLAKIFGRNFLKKKLVQKLFSLKQQERALRMVGKYGVWAVFIVRFIPGGIRNPVFFITGLSEIRHRSFIIASLSGATIVSQFSFWLGYFLHDQLQPEQFFKNLEQNIRYGFGLLAIVILIYILVKKRRKNEKNPTGLP
jgi:membrane protein DedA with SNARE-associated domain